MRAGRCHGRSPQALEKRYRRWATETSARPRYAGLSRTVPIRHQHRGCATWWGQLRLAFPSRPYNWCCCWSRRQEVTLGEVLTYCRPSSSERPSCALRRSLGFVHALGTNQTDPIRQRSKTCLWSPYTLTLRDPLQASRKCDRSRRSSDLMSPAVARSAAVVSQPSSRALRDGSRWPAIRPKKRQTRTQSPRSPLEAGTLSRTKAKLRTFHRRQATRRRPEAPAAHV